MVSPVMRLLPFVQLEFTHALGPAPGRYVVAAPGTPRAAALEGADVLLIDVTPAPAVKRRRMRSERGVLDSAQAGPVALAVVTYVRASLAGDEHGDAAARWVQACQEDTALQSSWVQDGLVVLNRAIRAHRASCGDPYFTEVTATDPRAARIGYGPAREVSAGRWDHAFTVEPIKPPRLGHFERNAPAEVVAAALAGRPVSLEADELILRGLLDLDHGRTACAVLQLHAAARLLTAEVADVDDATALQEHAAGLPALGARLQELGRTLPVPDGAVAVDELHEAAARLRTVADAWRAEVLDRFRVGD
jgi:hypothetical protein